MRLEDAGDDEPEPQLQTRLEDAGAAESKPQAAPYYAFDQTHRYSAVYTPFHAQMHGNVSLESPTAGLFHRGNGALRSAMHAAINLALDFNITTADLEKIGLGEKWLRQPSRTRLPAPNKCSSRRSLIRLRQSPVGLRIRLHKKTHEVHWPHQSELPRHSASCSAPPGPPISQPPDQSHHSHVCRAMTRISSCSWSRVKSFPFQDSHCFHTPALATSCGSTRIRSLFSIKLHFRT
jgi:hypothetical protein